MRVQVSGSLARATGALAHAQIVDAPNVGVESNGQMHRVVVGRVTRFGRIDRVCSVREARGHVQDHAWCEHDIDQRLSELRQVEGVMRLAAGERIGMRAACRRWRLVDAPALRAFRLQDKDVLLVGVRRRGGCRASGGAVEVETVWQPKGVERGEAHGTERRDVRARAVEDDRTLLERGLHVNVTHLRILKRRAARLRDGRHLPAAAASRSGTPRPASRKSPSTATCKSSSVKELAMPGTSWYSFGTRAKVSVAKTSLHAARPQKYS